MMTETSGRFSAVVAENCSEGFFFTVKRNENHCRAGLFEIVGGFLHREENLGEWVLTTAVKTSPTPSEAITLDGFRDVDILATGLKRPMAIEMPYISPR